jgi:signal transduction histidine kinase
MTITGTPHRSRWLGRHPLYGDVSSTAVVSAFGLAAVFSMSRSVSDLVVRASIGQLGAGLLPAGLEFAGHALMAAVFLLLLPPALSLAPRHGKRRIAVLALALIGASAVAALVRILAVNKGWQPVPSSYTWQEVFHRFFVRYFVRYGLLATLFVLIAEFQRAASQAAMAAHRAEVDLLALEREMSAARLQLLQAQVEPHFLFNTLANVRRLYQNDAATGREMLADLMRYLEMALPRMREETTTVGRECAMIRAYLNVQRIRMGRRLSFDVDVPAGLIAVAVPPMMLLTLVENALKHGIGPLPEGGYVRVDARVEAAQLVLRVSDSGKGFDPGSSGSGTGLANIRARLEAAFGTRAELALLANRPRGLTATLRLPLAEPGP